MPVNHALMFIHNGPRQPGDARTMEVFDALKAFWNARKQAGKIADFLFITPQSTGNAHMPAGFMLVTGDRATLQEIRWADEEYLKLHTLAMVTMKDFACLDAYAGEGHEKHMQRLVAATRK